MLSKHLHLSEDVCAKILEVARGERRSQSSLVDELLREALKRRMSNLVLAQVMEGANR